MNSLDRFRLDGRRALITGSTQGIGLAIAQSYAEAGAAQVIINSERDNEIARDALAALRESGPKTDCAYLCQDLAQASAGADLARATLELTSGYGVDLLVLCAAVQVEKPWLEITPRDFDLQISVNLQSSLELLQGLTPPMQERGFGRIIIVSSIQATRPGGSMLVYAATKAALNNMARGLGRMLGRSGITVNTISPGTMNTPRNAAALAEEGAPERVTRRIPIARVGEAEDCVGIALLLASEAGSYITGSDYVVDGGVGL